MEEVGFEEDNDDSSCGFRAYDTALGHEANEDNVLYHVYTCFLLLTGTAPARHGCGGIVCESCQKKKRPELQA